MANIDPYKLNKVKQYQKLEHYNEYSVEKHEERYFLVHMYKIGHYRNFEIDKNTYFDYQIEIEEAKKNGKKIEFKQCKLF